MAIESPEEYGGAGSTIFNAILAIEELARVDASVSVFVDVHNTLVTNAFMRWANDEQKKKYMPQLATQQRRCLRAERSSSGSDAFALKTRAVDKGDHFELTGQKLWITNGNEAEIFVSSRRSIRPPDTKASRRSSSRNSSRDFPSARKKTSSASARRRRPS